ncbi:MAG: ribosomal L7Ae/L30e/S12e/Gadd45 family protein [Thermacetogeniaceae bacterium]
MQRLLNAARKTVGLKQTLKAVERDQAEVVFVAQDAEKHIVMPLVDCCQEKGIGIVYVDSMKELGKVCGIKVGAASASILK